MNLDFEALWEGDKATERSWTDRFGGSGQIFQELLAEGILRATGLSNGQKQFTLNYVGLLSIDGAAWFAFPKASKCSDWSDAELILRAIVEYRRNTERTSRSFDFSATADRLYGGTLVDTFLGLVLHTFDTGFDRRPRTDTKSNHERIDWPRTINSSSAIHSKDSVFYPHPVSRTQYLELSDIAQIQAVALLEMRGRLGPFAAVIVPNAAELWEQCHDVLEQGESAWSRADADRIIDDYADHTNRDEDLALVNILRDWLREDWSSGLRLSPFGVSSFHTVWEDMCGRAFSSLGVPALHTEVASQPRYMLGSRELKLSPQRPDILLVRDGRVILADAKWYLLDENILPQTPDAIKQFSYEFSVLPGMRIETNSLLLPTEGKARWETVGHLQMANHHGIDLRFPSISIIAINWRYLTEIYVRQQIIPEDFINELIGTRSI